MVRKWLRAPKRATARGSPKRRPGAASWLAGGHDDGLELAGDRHRSMGLTLQFEQATACLGAELDQPRQVLQLAADLEVVGVIEDRLGT
jgi:hypothetical protein